MDETLKQDLVTSTQPVTPHNQAVYEAGKKLLVDSLDVGRDYCKHMITVSTGAIPIYIGLLKAFSSSLKPGFGIAAPALMFLLSAMLFVIGYFPRSARISLDLIEEITESLDTVVKFRQNMIIAGTFVFMLSMIVAIFLILK